MPQRAPSPEGDDTRTAYDVLQVSPRGSVEVIQAAYRVLARAYHPDVNASPQASRRMQEVNAAYAILIDPARRAEYDATHLPAASARRAGRIKPGRLAGDGPRPARHSAGAVRHQTARPIGLAVLAIIAAAVAALALALWVIVDDADGAAPGALAQLAVAQRAVAQLPATAAAPGGRAGVTPGLVAR